MLGGTSDEALIVDTRSTPAQAREILDDLRELGAPRVGIVVNTHGHYDHVFGNVVFRPAVIWGHERCRSMIEQTGEHQRAGLLVEAPKLADELAELVLDPPDRVFTDAATLDLAGREVRLEYLGRGHTDNDIVVSIPDADVAVRGRPAREREPAVLRGWLPDGLARDGGAAARDDRAVDRRRAGPRRPCRAFVRGAVGARDRGDRVAGAAGRGGRARRGGGGRRGAIPGGGGAGAHRAGTGADARGARGVRAAPEAG